MKSIGTSSRTQSLGRKKGGFVTLKLASRGKKGGRAHYAVPSYTFPGY